MNSRQSAPNLTNEVVLPSRWSAISLYRNASAPRVGMSVESRLSYVAATWCAQYVPPSSPPPGLCGERGGAPPCPRLDPVVPDAHAVGEVRERQDPDAGRGLRLRVHVGVVRFSTDALAIRELDRILPGIVAADSEPACLGAEAG